MRVHDRRVGIGASEVPVIAGLSPYRSPVELWLEKHGRGEGVRESDAMTIGRELEDDVLRLAARREGVRYRRNAVRRSHPDWPRVPLFATADAIGPAGTFLIEAKVVGFRMTWDWDAGAPAYVVLQAHAQMAVHRHAERTLIAGLLGTELRTQWVDRDEATIHEIELRTAEWWRDYMVDGRPPAPVDDDDVWQLLRDRVVRPPRDTRLPMPEENGLAVAYLEAKKQQAELAAAADQARLELALASDHLDIGGAGWTAKWSEREGKPVFTIRDTNPRKGAQVEL